MDEARVQWLEAQTDRLSQQVSLPNEFILPGDTPAGAALAVARTVTRRAERQVTQLSHSGDIENPKSCATSTACPPCALY